MSQTALSFHFGGAGSCDSCHSMHNPRDRRSSGDQSDSLLLSADPSSVCLNCHAGPGGMQRASVFSPDGSAMTPGGDFYWLNKTFVWYGGASAGESHGHNVIARDFNLGQDTRLTQAPGGSYRSADLACTSCHDPHGRVRGGTRREGQAVSVSGSYGEQPASGSRAGNYRLLGGADYGGGLAAEGFMFNYDAPVARQNKNSKFGESDISHVDYGTGMSEWCGNCHLSILREGHAGSGNFRHQSGSTATLGNVIVSVYNAYIDSGDLLATGGSGDAATAYLQFVPFERGISNPERLDPTSTAGPTSTSAVMCLSCHRAHSSAFRSIGRWDFDAELLSDSHPAPGDGGQSGNDVDHSYYGRNIPVEFGPEQRSFCEKCHGLDLEALLESGEEQLLDPLPDTGLEQPQVPDPLLQDPFEPL